MNETGRLRRLVIKHARDAFGDPERIGREWASLAFTAAPDFARAEAEYAAFEAAIASTGTELLHLPPTPDVTMDSIYVRDAAIASPRGMILCAMGKPARVTEPAAQRQAFARWGVPVLGTIVPPGRLEGGDLVWFDDRTLAVGQGYRTNADGIRQLRALVGTGVHVEIVPLPHWKGPGDVFHLMSMLSPVDRDLAVVYSPLMPVPFRDWLLDRGMTFVEVPDDDFASMAAKVLALAPRQCLMVEGNPRTRVALERAGADVLVYDGREISLKGGGGPTCLTRPIEREPL